jgi:hypothetical protein
MFRIKKIRTSDLKPERISHTVISVNEVAIRELFGDFPLPSTETLSVHITM